MNELVRPPLIGDRDGNWVWDGTRWVCCADDDRHPPVPCPPFGPPVFSGPAGQPPWYPGANGGVSFGQTAPPNPVRGHFWWDGTTLWLFDGAAWAAIGGQGGGAGGGTNPGSTPPTNPAVGTLWFDGTTLWIWNGTSWSIVGPGAGGGTIANPNVYSVTTYTTPGSFSFTIPTDVTNLTTFKFHLQAGGGGGGGISAGGGWSAQGGGGGEYKEVALVGAQKGLIVSATVGGGGQGGAGTGTAGGNGGDTQIFIANTNSTIVAKGGNGGWGGASSGPANNANQGLGGINGVFTPGTSNISLVLAIPGGDAALTGPSEWNDAGGNSYMGQGGPTFDDSIGWNDVTGPRGYGAAGRGAFNDGTAGQSGNGGCMIIERVNG